MGKKDKGSKKKDKKKKKNKKKKDDTHTSTVTVPDQPTPASQVGEIKSPVTET